jgi:acetyltransferase EpsM
MPPRSLVIVAGGQHARVVADAARATGEWQVIGFTRESADDPARDDAADTAARLGAPLLGDDRAFATKLEMMAGEDRPWLVLGFGGPPDARRLAVSAFGEIATWATIVHPTAWISPSARIAPGAVVLAGAVVNAAAHVGAHAIVNTRVVVEHDVSVGAFTHLAPGVVIGGGATIGDDTMVGLSAAIRDHVAIGHRATVAMGAVVVGPVGDGELVVGVPARRAVGPASAT